MELIEKETLAKIHQCMNFMDDGDFDKAEEEFQEILHGGSTGSNDNDDDVLVRVYACFALACVTVIKALMSQTAVDNERGFEHLRSCQVTAQAALTELTFTLYPQLRAKDHGMLHLTSLVKGEGDLLLHHLHLIIAECTLLTVVLESLLMSDNGNILQLTTKRQKRLYSAYFSLFYAQSGLQQGDKFDHEYVCGVAFSWGLINLLFSLLPSQFSGCFATEHFNLDALLILIERSLDASTIHGRFARLLMIFFHLTITYDLSEVSRLSIQSSKAEALDTSSPLNVYLSARLLHLQGKNRASLDLLTASAVSPSRNVIGIHLPCYWEAIKCLTEEQRWHEAIQLTQKLRPFPSVIGSFYLEAVMTQASTGRLGNSKLSPQVQALFREILKLASNGTGTGTGTKSLSTFDRLAVRRANDCLQNERLFFASQYELLLLWDRIGGISDASAVAQEISLTMEKYTRQMTPEQMILGWLLLALLTGDGVQLISNHILPRDYLPPGSEYYVLRAKVELARMKRDPGLLAEVEQGCSKPMVGQGGLLIKIAQLKLELSKNKTD